MDQMKAAGYWLLAGVSSVLAGGFTGKAWYAFLDGRMFGAAAMWTAALYFLLLAGAAVLRVRPTTPWYGDTNER